MNNAKTKHGAEASGLIASSSIDPTVQESIYPMIDLRFGLRQSANAPNNALISSSTCAGSDRVWPISSRSRSR